MARMLVSILSAAILIAAATPAAEARLSVADYLESYAALKAVESVPETQRASYMATHAAELERATHVQEQAATVYETLLAVDDASFERYRHNVLCNFMEEDQPVTFLMAVEAHVRALREEQQLDEAEIAKRLRYTDFSEVLVDEMLDHYACPVDAPGSAASWR